jgi:peptide-methionine (R)-S-oxide reductase
VSRVGERPPPVGEKLELSDREWRERLTREQYRVLRQQGTERAFSGAHHDEHRAGTYYCAGCGAPLYSSQHKFDSGTGWPSFYQAIEDGRVERRSDRSHGMVRTELRCARCEGHLGHVFDDGPPPTGQRHCINSVSLTFEPS